MPAAHLELLVEEPSMEAFLRSLLPRLLLQDRTFEVHPFQGKNDLLSKLEPRLRGYAAWIPADWRIVVVVANVPSRRGFRDPDAIAGGTWEAFERVMWERGYFAGGLRKIEAARAIGAHVELDRSKSASFRSFGAAIIKACA